MKKIYESPIVEITVFDVEDVITTSVATINTTGWTAADVEAVAAFQTAVGQDTKVDFYGSYNW